MLIILANVMLAHLPKLLPGLLKGVASLPQNPRIQPSIGRSLPSGTTLGSMIDEGKIARSTPTFKFDQYHFQEIEHVVVDRPTIQVIKGLVSGGREERPDTLRAGDGGVVQPPSSRYPQDLHSSNNTSN